MLERKECAECGDKISSGDLRDGIARQVKDQYYCRKCTLDLGLLSRRGSDTDAFINGVHNVLGDVEITAKETLQVERKARKQVALFLERVLAHVRAHPSWAREDIIAYLENLLKEEGSR